MGEAWILDAVVSEMSDPVGCIARNAVLARRLDPSRILMGGMGIATLIERA